MTTTKNNEHKKLNFFFFFEQSQACLNSAQHEKNQGRKVLNVPNLRFKEFQGEWEKTKFGDIATGFDYGMNAAAKNYDGVNKYIRITDIDEASSTYIDKDIVSPDDVLTDNYLVNNRDILLARTGASTGKSYLYKKSDGKLYYAGFLIRANVTTHDPYFVFSQLHTHRYWRWVYIMSARSGQPGINSQEYSSFPIYTTSIEEESKIAKLLSLLDERIATQNKIIDKLQSLIKGIGKQLFMDNQNWRTVKIGELLRIGNGKDYKHLSIGKIPVYGTGGQMLLVNDYLYDGESVCIGRKGTIDTPMFLKGKFWTVDTLFYTYDFKDVLPKFCYYLFLQINWKLYNEGTGVPSLSKSTIENIKVKIPSLEQQKKICSILDCYEHKTNNEEQILELYHSEKQYLLRQMFI